MRAGILVALLLGGLASAQGLGIKTEDPKLQALADMSANARYEAWRKLVRAGRGSVPTFVAMLDEKHLALRGLGASGLAQLGPLASEAVPALCRVLEEQVRAGSMQLAAIGALGNIGPDAATAVPSLRKRLGSTDRIDVLTSAAALTRIDPGAKELPAAVARLLDREGMETPRALWMVQRLGPAAAVAETGVATILARSRNGFVRAAAVRALGAIGTRNAKSLELVRRALVDDEQLVRVTAASVLVQRGAVDGAVRKVLEDGLVAKRKGTMRGRDQRVCVIAAGALLRTDPSDERAASVLREALQAATRTHQLETVEAIRQLRGLGPAAKPFAVLLEEIAPQSVPRVEGDAALALWAITADRERSLKLARRALTHGHFVGCADVVRLVRNLEK